MSSNLSTNNTRVLRGIAWRTTGRGIHEDGIKCNTRDKCFDELKREMDPLGLRKGMLIEVVDLEIIYKRTKGKWEQVSTKPIGLEYTFRI